MTTTGSSTLVTETQQDDNSTVTLMTESDIVSYTAVTSPSPSPGHGDGFWEDPMTRSFGIVIMLFVFTLIVGGVNVGIWFLERKKNHRKFAGGMTAEGGGINKGTNLNFSLGKRSTAVGSL